MRIHVRLFAAAAEAAGQRAVELELPDQSSVQAAREALAGIYPRLAPLLALAHIARNQMYCQENETLNEGDELAVIPPVSGGSEAGMPPLRPDWPGREAPIAAVTSVPLRIEPLIARVDHPAAGAVVTFLGQVRAITEDEATVALVYEAYPEMAEARMRDIAQDIAQRWPGARTAMAHRVGRLEPGETAVAIAVSAPHRPAAFEACRHAIEAIKRDVPIWKQELRPDGRREWIGHA